LVQVPVVTPQGITPARSQVSRKENK